MDLFLAHFADTLDQDAADDVRGAGWHDERPQTWHLDFGDVGAHAAAYELQCVGGGRWRFWDQHSG